MSLNKTPIRFEKEREETATAYAVYRCAGPGGCGERVTMPLAQHAANQHGTYDFETVDKING